MLTDWVCDVFDGDDFELVDIEDVLADLDSSKDFLLRKKRDKVEFLKLLDCLAADLFDAAAHVIC